MFNISQYFTTVAAKYLTAVDIQPSRSNQHEFGGLVRAGFGKYLKTPDTDAIKYQAEFIYFNDIDEQPLTSAGEVTWYDSRVKKSHRGPELRLYYKTNKITELLSAGDLMIIGLRPDNTIVLFFTRPGTQHEHILCYLFNIKPQNNLFSTRDLEKDKDAIDITGNVILQFLGIEPVQLEEVSLLEEIVIEKFGHKFPPTYEFSRYARDTLGDMDAVNYPDLTLLEWMQREEELFFALEKVVLKDKISESINSVDEFIKLSLSVQNRRKSRAGYALENHFAEILDRNEIRYQRGAITENRATPDFLFPGASEYHNNSFNDKNLFMLGCKTTCKERWRQVLSEAGRIRIKHLLTLEPAISETQTTEMSSNDLQLVVPQPLQNTYNQHQQQWLLSLKDFLQLIRDHQ